MRLPSTTQGSSTQSAPALTMSSRIAPTLVARRPLTICHVVGGQPGDGDVDLFLPQAIDGIEQLHVLEEVGGQHEDSLTLGHAALLPARPCDLTRRRPPAWPG
jgi:hypothetical protein